MERCESEREVQRILWDVVEEHLDEAGFCWWQWERALLSPQYSMMDLDKKVESRLLAHLDGLLVGGKAVIETVVVPALDASDPGSVFCSAYVLASSELAFAEDCLFSHLELAAPRNLDAVSRALAVAPREQHGTLRLLHSSRPELQALAVDVLSFRRTAAAALGSLLPELLRHEDARLRAAAARAARRWPALISWDATASIVRSADTAPAALEAAVILGALDARQLSSVLARQKQAPASTAMLLLAMMGSVRDCEQLAAIADPRLRRDALFAMGFSGSIPLVDPILRLMREPDLAALAGEALAGITGLDIEKAGGGTKAPAPAGQSAAEADPPELADPQADLNLTAEADLPVPDPDAALAWWQEHKAAFDPATRYVHGLPFAGEQTLLDALARVPMRRRHALALELAIVSRGQLHVETMALARDQLRYLPPQWQALAQPKSGTTAPRVTHG